MELVWGAVLLLATVVLSFFGGYMLGMIKTMEQIVDIELDEEKDKK